MFTRPTGRLVIRSMPVTPSPMWRLTERGSIWVSYFDEGVFGHTPLGQAGFCVPASIRVAVLSSASPTWRTRGDFMADCYA